MLRTHAPEPWVSKLGNCIAQVEVLFTITLAFQCKNCVWSNVSATVNSCSEMYSEEGKPRVWQGINQCVHEVLAFRDKVVILAPKRYDPKIRVIAGHPTNPVTVKACTIYQEP